MTALSSPDGHRPLSLPTLGLALTLCSLVAVGFLSLLPGRCEQRLTLGLLFALPLVVGVRAHGLARSVAVPVGRAVALSLLVAALFLHPDGPSWWLGCTRCAGSVSDTCFGSLIGGTPYDPVARTPRLGWAVPVLAAALATLPLAWGQASRAAPGRLVLLGAFGGALLTAGLFRGRLAQDLPTGWLGVLFGAQAGWAAGYGREWVARWRLAVGPGRALRHAERAAPGALIAAALLVACACAAWVGAASQSSAVAATLTSDDALLVAAELEHCASLLQSEHERAGRYPSSLGELPGADAGLTIGFKNGVLYAYATPGDRSRFVLTGYAGPEVSLRIDERGRLLDGSTLDLSR